MTNLPFLTKWRMIGDSVQGYSHIRKGTPNQDAFAYTDQDEPGEERSSQGNVYIMSISDGHGSAKSFRSDVGSRFAVRIAKEQISQFFNGRIHSTPELVERSAYEELVPAILSQWRSDVETHLKSNPVTDEERQNLSNQEQLSDEKANLLISSSPRVIYGATLVSVAITDELILYLRIGDGDIINVSPDGSSAFAIEKDADMLGVETDSLCQNDADIKFRIKVIQRSPSDPAMILLSTDGYNNSFKNEEGFLAIGGDYLRMIRSYGSKFMLQQLPLYLAETSKGGSGDDITLGVMKRPEFFDADVQKEMGKFLDGLMICTNGHSDALKSLAEQVKVIDTIHDAVDSQQAMLEQEKEKFDNTILSLAQLRQSQDDMAEDINQVNNQVETTARTIDEEVGKISTVVAGLQLQHEQNATRISDFSAMSNRLREHLETQQGMINDGISTVESLKKTDKALRILFYIALTIGVINTLFLLLLLLWALRMFSG